MRDEEFENIVNKYRTIFLDLSRFPTGAVIKNTLYKFAREIKEIEKYKTAYEIYQEYRNSEERLLIDFEEWIECKAKKIEKFKL